uniref:Uncharacterized protein n=1 Tax=Eutreptiella gymnastica TaxID=73025 RepID=A0A7S1ICQ3_9EUGL
MDDGPGEYQGNTNGDPGGVGRTAPVGSNPAIRGQRLLKCRLNRLLGGERCLLWHKCATGLHIKTENVLQVNNRLSTTAGALRGVGCTQCAQQKLPIFQPWPCTQNNQK